MNDDSRKSEGADGWVDPHAATEWGLEAVSEPPPGPTQMARAPSSATPPVDSIEAGKAMALLSHASVLLGLPLFVIPMMQRDNDFALVHSKAAAVNFIFFIVALTLTMMTCGLAFPLIFLVYVPMIIGCVDAMNGRRPGALAWGGSGEKMFAGLQIKDDTNLLE